MAHAFFLALAIPGILLIYRAYDQLKWEVFHQYRVSAEELSARIDAEVHRLIAVEESRSFSDYAFLAVSGDAGATFVQRSPLSQFPVASAIPGLVGYFQVDSAGKLTSPIVPTADSDYANYGVTMEEYRQRLALHERLQRILDTPMAVPEAQLDNNIGVVPMEPKDKAAELRSKSKVRRDLDDAYAVGNVFDRLSNTLGAASRQQASSDYGRVEDLKLDSRLEKKSREQKLIKPTAPERSRTVGKRASRKEQVAVYELAEESAQEDLLHAEN